MPQPAGQKLGTPYGQGEAKLKRFPLILGVIGWILVICSFFPLHDHPRRYQERTSRRCRLGVDPDLDHVGRPHWPD